MCRIARLGWAEKKAINTFSGLAAVVNEYGNASAHHHAYPKDCTPVSSCLLRPQRHDSTLNPGDQNRCLKTVQSTSENFVCRIWHFDTSSEVGQSVRTI